jgi:hypothetical protein
MTSEDVIKEIKWQKALNDEIDVIKKKQYSRINTASKRIKFH